MAICFATNFFATNFLLSFTYHNIQYSIQCILVYLQACVITWNIFITPKKTLNLSQSLPIPPFLQSLATITLLTTFTDLPILEVSYRWNHITYDLLCLASFTYYNVLRYIHAITCICSSYFFMANQISLCKQITFSLFIS